MGWRPSVKVFSGCQSQDSTKKMEDPSFPVSPDSAGPQLLSISASFAAPLKPPPPRSVSRSGRCRTSACRRVQRRKMGRKVGAGWRVPTIGCLEVPHSRRNFTLMRLFIGRLHGVTCRGNRNVVLLIPAVIADHPADKMPAMESPGLNFMFYVYTLSNKVN